MQWEKASMRIGWVCLLVVSIGILAFGVVTATVGDGLHRADGVALTGLGLFGCLLTLMPFRRRERWAWFALWFYPVFWLAHLIGRLPPGKDHIHQVLFIVLSLAGLLVPLREFFHRRPEPVGGQRELSRPDSSCTR